jgi:hypothetical protein
MNLTLFWSVLVLNNSRQVTVDWTTVLSFLTPKPKKDDPLTKQEELLENPALVGLNTVTMTLMVKLGLVLLPRLYFAAALDEMPGASLGVLRTQLIN